VRRVLGCRHLRTGAGGADSDVADSSHGADRRYSCKCTVIGTRERERGRGRVGHIGLFKIYSLAQDTV
jgi:hypothetical protein